MAQGSKNGAAPQVKRGWIRVLVLTILSMGLYSFYWFYVTRRQIFAEQGNTTSSPLLHTLGLFVPILQFVVFYWLAKDADALAAKVDANRQSVPLLVILWIFFGPAALVLAQVAVNDYWDKQTKGKAADIPLKFVEFVPVILATLFWVMMFALMGLLIVLGVGDQAKLGTAADHVNRAASLSQAATANPAKPSQAKLSEARAEVAKARDALTDYRSGTLADREYADALLSETNAVDRLIAIYAAVAADGQISPAELIRYQSVERAYERAVSARERVELRRENTD